MTDQDISPTVFFIQLSEVAPAVNSLLNGYTARIRSSVTSHDAVNGYGIGFTFHVFIEVLAKRCDFCQEDDFSEPHFDCRWHKFEPTWVLIADHEGRDTANALQSVNMLVDGWLKRRESKSK